MDNEVGTIPNTVFGYRECVHHVPTDREKARRGLVFKISPDCDLCLAEMFSSFHANSNRHIAFKYDGVKTGQEMKSYTIDDERGVGETVKKFGRISYLGS
jgi:hypothetical protein